MWRECSLNRKNVFEVSNRAASGLVFPMTSTLACACASALQVHDPAVGAGREGGIEVL